MAMALAETLYTIGRSKRITSSRYFGDTNGAGLVGVAGVRSIQVKLRQDQ